MRTGRALLPFLAACAFAAALALSACSPDPAEKTALDQAREALSSGYFLEAEKGFEDYIRSHPRGRYRLEAWNRLVDTASLRGDTDKVADILEAMLLEYAQDPDTRSATALKLAELYDHLDRSDLALDLWRSVLDQKGLPPERRPEILRRMAKAARARGQAEASIQHLRDCAATAQKPDDRAVCLYELAQGLTLDQRLPAAKETVEEVRRMAQAPAHIRVQATFLLAEIHELDRNTKAARDLYESIRGLYPNREALEYRLKNLGLEKGKPAPQPEPAQ
jgi:tetratricopeptide (TPR) repeat protein